MFDVILNLFGRSPFAPLQTHMEKVSACVHLLVDLFQALEKKDYPTVESVATKIGEIEHQADITKNDIRNHLPKSLFLPIERSHLLEILSIQDHLADTAEDIAVLVTIKPIELLPNFSTEFKEFLMKNLSTFESTLSIIKEMHELLESSFGGLEAEKVRAMIDEVSFKEHEVDLYQRLLLKKLFADENAMTYPTFCLWIKISGAIGEISNLSDKLASRIRLTLEPK